MGVDYTPSYQTSVRLNGQYFGKYSTTVSWNSDVLKLNGYATKPKSPNFKSEVRYTRINTIRLLNVLF
jgi:hypothetical protein